MTGQASRNEPDTPVDPPAWPDGCLAVLHELWGDAIAGKPYDRAQKLKFARLLAGLERKATRDGYVLGRTGRTVESRRE